MNINVLHEHSWNPLQQYGFTHPFWKLQTDTILSTWFLLFLISIAAWYINRILTKEKHPLRFLVLKYVEAFKDLFLQSLRYAPIEHVAFITSIFTFILLSNIASLIPWLEEPTKDLNTTFALGIISFLYVHGTAIRTNGFSHYAKGYFQPFAIMLPLNIIGTFSTILSLSFRLFGNIFGGFIISSLYFSFINSSIWLQIFGLVSGLNLGISLAFGICEGFIQAFVFSVLTLTYLSLEIAHEDEEETE
jgi:F-type H+-transporting ATPase subunit a